MEFMNARERAEILRITFVTLTRTRTEGNEKIKDEREKLGRKSSGFTREMAKEAPKARLGEIAQGRFNLDKVRKPHALVS
jgi:hypothetical protein